MNRREILAGTAAAITLATVPPGFSASANRPTELRIGYQKSSILLIPKLQGVLEKRFGPDGIKVTWTDFQFGPPLLEALSAGALDYGSTGDAPPIFAQAAHANIVYVEAIPARGKSLGIVVHKNSSIKSVVELKGKVVGVAKGSSAHDLLVAALESVGLDWKEITPAYLAPADAASAFSRGAIDAWAIWDPFLAIVELNAGARQLPLDPETFAQNSFFLANRSFAAKYPEFVRAINADIETATQWAGAHRNEAAELFSKASGVPLAAEQLVVARADYTAGPLDDKIIARQQAVADRFYKLGLIPEKIKVSDIVWNSKAGT
jgi:sulfonate transport system substrate-binding protein